MPLAEAGNIYKSVDSKGNTIFTDQPIEGAESITEKVRKATAVKSAKVDTQVEKRQPDTPENEANGKASDSTQPAAESATTETEALEVLEDDLSVSRVEILSPKRDSNLIDPKDQISIAFQSYPTEITKSGLTAEVWIDDKFIASDKRAVLKVPTPSLGTHVLQVRLVDENGESPLQSKAVQFHVLSSGAN